MNDALNEFTMLPQSLVNDFLSMFQLSISEIIIIYSFFLIVGYLIGSVPFGLIFTRLAGLGDVRSIGSGNIGATNVLRTGNKKIAALTLLCDTLKGTLAVCIALYICRSPSCSLTIPLIAFGAFIGHLFPIWLGFKGGKGVATYLGVLIGLYWPLAIVFAIIWLLTAYISRYSSLSALLAVIIVPIAAFVFKSPIEYSFILIIMSIIVLIKHHENIARLLKGAESKIGSKGK